MQTEELSLTGNSLKQGFCDGDALKRGIQKTTEQHWGDVLESDEPSYRYEESSQ